MCQAAPAHATATSARAAHACRPPGCCRPPHRGRLPSPSRPHHAAPEELGQQLDVGRLAAALARAAELHQRRLELRAAHRCLLKQAAAGAGVGGGQCGRGGPGSGVMSDAAARGDVPGKSPPTGEGPQGSAGLLLAPCRVHRGRAQGTARGGPQAAHRSGRPRKKSQLALSASITDAMGLGASALSGHALTHSSQPVQSWGDTCAAGEREGQEGCRARCGAAVWRRCCQRVRGVVQSGRRGGLNDVWVPARFEAGRHPSQGLGLTHNVVVVAFRCRFEFHGVETCPGPTCMRYWKPSSAAPPPRMGTAPKPAGAPDSSSGVASAWPGGRGGAGAA